MTFVNEKSVETKTCKQCNISFDITDKDLEFYDKVSPIFNGEKYNIPTPKLCPDCRQQRRLSFRNERNLYKRKCNATGKDIISMYSPNKRHIIYNMDLWLSDNWDALDYGVDISFDKPLFEQFNLILEIVPRIPLFQSQNENSEYTNGSQKNKDCYMIFVSDYNEKCYYTNGLWYSEYVIDCLGVNKSNNCYECVDSDNCRNCFYSQDLIGCKEVFFSKNCRNCTNCYLSEGLNGKEFYINNIQYTKDEYQKKIKNIKGIRDLNTSSTNLYYHGFGIENSSGDFIKNLSNSNNCFDSQDLEDCKNITYGINIKDSYDSYVIVDNSEKCYESISCISNYQGLFLYSSWYNNNCYYVDTCQNSENLFFCAGLKNKQYCIFNKQYTKEEYNILVPRVINHMKETGEWGEFFPSSISPFGYNETVAQEYFPLEKQEALNNNFNWSDYETPLPKVDKVIPASQLPENISDIPDDILNWAIECEITKKPFRIIPQELEFYRKHSLPIPRRHPDRRHLDRMELRNPRKLFKRDCDKCGTQMDTTYSPDKEITVYCEGCYNKEIY